MTTNTLQTIETQNNVLENYYTVRTFSEKFPFVSQSSLRFLIFNADENRLNEFKVIKRIGKKILLDSVAFDAWLKGTNQENIVQFN